MQKWVYGWSATVVAVAGMSVWGEGVPQRTTAELTEEDKAWWAYQPVRRPEVPEVAVDAKADGFQVRTPVDAFLWDEARRRGESLPGPVESAALLRRVTFDLTGLPPTPDALADFLADPSALAYERVVDQLLASPHHGEKWAQHWLDVVRYAESDGYRQDAYRPHAWQYRDWVVSAMNADEPYDRFVQAQLAGDVMFPDDPAARIATGFYRATVYEYNNRDAVTQWQEIVAETTDTVGDVFLGLGLQCARCHDHKFDAIQQDDYRRLQACFSGMIWEDDRPAATPDEIVAWQAREDAWRAENREALDALDAFEAPFRAQLAAAALEKFPKEIEAIWRRGEASWSREERPWMDFVQRQIKEEWRDVSKAMKGEDKNHWRQLSEAVKVASASRPAPLPQASSVTEMTADPDTGTASHRPAAGFLTVLGKEPATGNRRAALAQWLTRPDHPLTARVIVNRLWQEYFGRGLVATPSDFGRLGEPPTAPALLDWLAAECVDGGWKLKRLHRLVVLSEAYRLQGGEATWWRTAFPRRLSAEQIRDASLAATGELDLTAGGPSVSSDHPRRTIFTKRLRNTPDPLRQSFDTPDAFRSAATRQSTVTSTQSLLLINGQWMQNRAHALAVDLLREWPEQSVERVRHAALRTTGVDPTSEEIAEALTFLQRQSAIVRQGAAPLVPEAVFAESRELPRHGMALVVAEPTVVKRMFPAMTLADGVALEHGGFTMEAIVNLRSPWPDGRVRTVAARWDGNEDHEGWALGVTGNNSRFTPGTLILQVVGTDATGARRYQVAASDLPVPPGRPWFVAASFADGGTVRFCVQDLGDPDAVAREAVVALDVVRLTPDPAAPVTLGARNDPAHSHHFDGVIGEARLTARPLESDQWLTTAAVAPAHVLGHWKFEAADGVLADTSPAGNPLVLPESPAPSDPQLTALTDYCHALFNSNAFLYVD